MSFPILREQTEQNTGTKVLADLESGPVVQGPPYDQPKEQYPYDFLPPDDLAWRMAAGSRQQVNSGDDDLAWLERVLPAAAYAMYIHDDVP